ncbi:MAG: peptide ABC transporter substrate-binding protein [Candidatus Eremiobacteraeota bacterium]|nr:peptide ABC transporter substrate-binding protein [Candidatus Eremiobacteraeota bacterium]
MAAVTRRTATTGALLAALLLAAPLIFAGCSKVTTATHPGGRGVPGVVRIVGASSMDSAVPELSATITAVDAGMFWAGWFFAVNDRGELEPDLATVVPTTTNGGISADGLRITYHLRRGVRWHDGFPFDARDAIFTWHQIMNPANNVLTREGWNQIASMSAPDPYTLIVRLRRPYAPAITTFFGPSLAPVCVLPEHLLRGLPNINHAAYNRKPIGTGPFIVQQFDVSSGLTMTANPHYWRGAPKLREVRYMLVSDENTRVVQMHSGEADLYYDPSTKLVPQLANIPGTHELHTVFNEFWFLTFNLRHAPLDAHNVRLAISQAIDRGYILRTVLHGAARLAESDQPPFSWAYDPAVRAPGYDPVAAAQHLDAAGWKVARDGVRMKQGRRFELVYAYDVTNGDSARIGTVVQSMLRKIGIALQLKGYPNSLYYAAKAGGGILNNGLFDVAHEGWIGGVDPDDQTLWTCDERPPGGFNHSFVCDPRIDAQERVALRSYDRAVRRRAYDRVQELLRDDLPVLFLYWSMRNDSVRDSLHGFRPAPSVSEFWNAWEWND